MSRNVTTIPDVPRPFYTIQRNGRFWAIQLVTPVYGGEDRRATIAQCVGRTDAVAIGKARAAAARRPFLFTAGQRGLAE